MAHQDAEMAIVAHDRNCDPDGRLTPRRRGRKASRRHSDRGLGCRCCAREDRAQPQLVSSELGIGRSLKDERLPHSLQVDEDIAEREGLDGVLMEHRDEIARHGTSRKSVGQDLQVVFVQFDPGEEAPVDRGSRALRTQPPARR